VTEVSPISGRVETFDSSAVPRCERGPWWEDVLSKTCAPLKLNVSDAIRGSDFNARAERRWIDDLSLVEMSCDPCVGDRSAAHVASTVEDCVAVLVTLSGCEAVSQGDDTMLLRAGDAVLWDTQNPIRFEVLEPVRKRTLLVPRSALHEVSGRSWSASEMTFHSDSPAVRLLISYIALMSATLGDLPTSAVSAARNATLNLVVGAAHPDPSTDSITGAPGLRAAIDRWIDARLLDPDLSLASVAAAHSVSVRTVQRVYGMTGHTINGTVRKKRLARARDELGRGGDSIAAIAYRWSFSDASHFSRLFKEQFGVSPSVYRSKLHERQLAS